MSRLEKGLSKKILESLSLWGMVVFYRYAIVYAPDFAPLLGIVAMFGWLWWAQKQRLKFTEILALGHYTIALIVLVYHCADNNSIGFFSQSWAGRTLMLASFGTLWLLPQFAKWIAPIGVNDTTATSKPQQSEEVLEIAIDGREKNETALVLETNKLESYDLLQVLKLLFYFLIPIIALPTAWEEFAKVFDTSGAWFMPAHFNLVVWASVLIAFGLSEWKKTGISPLRSADACLFRNSQYALPNQLLLRRGWLSSFARDSFL